MNESTLQFISIILSNVAVVGCIWWFRKESRDDVKEFRRECREDWIRCQNTIDAIKDEMRDFHNRLIEIEKKRCQ